MAEAFGGVRGLRERRHGAVQNLLTDDVVYHVGGRNPLAGDYRGKDSVLGFIGELVSQTGGNYKLEVRDALGSDQHGAALVREVAERQGRDLDHNAVHLYRMVDGKVAEGWFYADDPYMEDEFWS
jgi:uncharacterized protein